MWCVMGVVANEEQSAETMFDGLLILIKRDWIFCERSVAHHESFHGK